MGLSPRARGNALLGGGGLLRPGAIPASAGERGAKEHAAGIAGGYPRERGGTGVTVVGQVQRMGLSPRARGNVLAEMRDQPFGGAIPASAGERRNRRPHRRRKWGYPRERGGTLMILIEVPSSEGLSPRARGNGAGVSSVDPGGGAIPASAGERLTSTASAGALRGYPRERGGTTYCSAILPSPSGLSPRARGNAELIAFCVERSGAIPSSAGERR